MVAQRFLKRLFDVGFTLMASILLLPIGTVVGILIWLESPGPIIYRSERVGRWGRRFTLYKFRTMILNAPAQGPPITFREDPRVTRIGRVLRRTKFDEFPQVINVLRGDMSIVGPRPECEEYANLYSPEQRVVLSMRPGLTSLAQVAYREEESELPEKDTETYYVREVMPRKLALDMYFVQHWSLLLDFKVFVLGVLALLKLSPPALLWPKEEGVLSRRRV